MDENYLPKSTLPTEAVVLFYRISLWVESCNYTNKSLNNWKKAVRNLELINCHKKDKEPYNNPQTKNQNTLYVPKSYSGKNLLKQLRNAFCHNGITYNNKTKQYIINQNEKIKISGSFSLEAIKELLDHFFLVQQ